MTPAERQARHRARLRQPSQAPPPASVRRSLPRPRRWAAAVANADRSARRLPRLARQPPGQPRRVEAGGEAASHHRDRPRRAAGDRSTARLRPRLTGKVLDPDHPSPMTNLQNLTHAGSADPNFGCVQPGWPRHSVAPSLRGDAPVRRIPPDGTRQPTKGGRRPHQTSPPPSGIGCRRMRRGQPVRRKPHRVAGLARRRQSSPGAATRRAAPPRLEPR